VRAAAAVLLAALALAGCSSGGDSGDEPAVAPRAAEPAPEAGAIRGWIAAHNAGDHESAADYFLPGALVEQGRLARLRTHAEAVAFNRALPCRATVTDVEKAAGDTVVAAFKLRPGEGSPESCGGDGVRVRFRFRGRKFLEWRQLPESEEPPDQSA
jgi:hypothetical protein